MNRWVTSSRCRHIPPASAAPSSPLRTGVSASRSPPACRPRGRPRRGAPAAVHHRTGQEGPHLVAKRQVLRAKGCIHCDASAGLADLTFEYVFKFQGMYDSESGATKQGWRIRRRAGPGRAWAEPSLAGPDLAGSVQETVELALVFDRQRVPFTQAGNRIQQQRLVAPLPWLRSLRRMSISCSMPSRN